MDISIGNKKPERVIFELVSIPSISINVHDLLIGFS